jgi:molybdate/tungstate transport system ATP-binding protein
VIELGGVELGLGAFRLGALELTVPAGAYTVVLGPSGSGKSVLLRLVAGLLRPERGSIRLGGKEAAGWPVERRRLGFVFPDAALFPHLSVAQNVAYGLRGLPAPARADRVREVAASLGVQALLDRAVGALSGGEAQRVALARALAPRPRVVLLDEPLAHLDPQARLDLQAELGRLHRELGFTALHVTHDRQEARALGERLAVLEAGRLVQEGPLDEVLARPASGRVARFLGLHAGGEG